uniref:SAV_2336 N-terminal domain-related protein n=1 Tax=Paractinoplanes polyasparticus TaxID=2856853 RepID=UPI001C866CC0|nr:SAV_2336 N-terminal domain-related protein [Actinoplanes polyasparticus]
MNSDLLPPITQAVAKLMNSSDLEWSASPDDVCDALWLARHLPADLGLMADGVTKAQPENGLAENDAESAPPADLDPLAPDEVSSDVVFPRGKSARGALHRAARPLTLPRIRPLTDSLAVGRALRPLRIRRPSRSRLTVDERSTADQAARSGLWQPILRPRQERWPDVAVVIDGGSTMSLWREEIDGFQSLLGQLGAFRQLRTWRLTSGTGGVRVSPHLTAPAGRADNGMDPVATLHDAAGRRLIVVVTDGVHHAWGNGRYHDTLTRLGATNPVIVVSILPHWLWPANGIQVRPGRVRVQMPMSANARWGYRRVEDMVSNHRDDCPVPVLDLSPRRLGKGVNMLVGGSAWARMRLLHDHRDQPLPDVEELPDSDDLPDYFASQLSPAAWQLLQALACMPDFLRMEAIRAVQHRLFPDTGVAELAEVLLCGVFESPEQSVFHHGNLFRFRRSADVAALADAASPVDEVAVKRILGEQLEVSRGQSRRVLVGGISDPNDKLVEAAEVPMSRLSVLPPDERRSSGPRQLVLRDVVCQLAAQSRARAKEILAEQGIDTRGLRLLDAAVLRLERDEGTLRLHAERSAEGITALHLDNADRLTALPKLRSAVLAMIGAGAIGEGPQLVILSRRPSTKPGVSSARTQAELLPLRLDALLGDGPPVAYSYTRELQELVEETAAVRIFRLTVGRIGRVPIAFEDRLWQHLSRSSEIDRVSRRHFHDLAMALVAEIGRRRRARLGPMPRGVVEPIDLPDDFEAFLRSMS